MLITELTPAQERALLAERERWYAIGAQTGPADREVCRETLRAIYRLMGKEAPDVLFCASPLACMLAKAAVDHALGDSLSAALRNALGVALLSAVRMPSLGVEVRDALRDALFEPLGVEVRDALRDALRVEVRDALGVEVRDALENFFYGSHDAGWSAYYDFPQKYLGVRYQSTVKTRFDLWSSMTQHAGWWLPYERMCFVADRPVVQHVNAQRRLHCEDGPAMAFADGFSLWYWHGVRVPRDIILHPDTITMDAIRAESHTEIRRIMIERHGGDHMTLMRRQ